MNKKIFAIILVLFMLFVPLYTYADENNISFKYNQDEQIELDGIPEIGCKAAYIAEPTTGKVIYEKNAHESLYPASTTKILTALVTMENCELDEKAVVSQNALNLVPAGYSNAKLQAGEELDISTLLYALLLPSANEAANVLAEHVSGSVEEFVELCNKRAKELGCENLHFTNTNGLHDEDHYCSAYDLYLIAKECQKHDIFNEIVKTKKFTVPATSVHPANDRTFENTNELLLSGKSYYEYCTGIKTGHTTPAGECLVASSSYNGMNLISVVLGGKQSNSLGYNERFYDTKQLFEFANENYSIQNIADKGDIVANITVGKATKETSSLDAIVLDDISTVVPNNINKDTVERTITIDENIEAPITQNQILGSITYSADGLEYTTNIVASHSVDKLPYYKYNIIVVTVLVLSFIIILVLIRVFKKHKAIALIIIIFMIIGEAFGIINILNEGERNSKSIVNEIHAENL